MFFWSVLLLMAAAAVAPRGLLPGVHGTASDGNDVLGGVPLSAKTATYSQLLAAAAAGKPLKPSKVYSIKIGASGRSFVGGGGGGAGRQATATTTATDGDLSAAKYTKALKWLKTGKHTDKNLLKSMLPALLAKLASEKSARSHGTPVARVERKIGQSPVYTIRLPSRDSFYENNEVDVGGGGHDGKNINDGKQRRRHLGPTGGDDDDDSEYYAKKPFAVSEYHVGPRSDQVMLRRVNRLPVSFNANGRPRTVSRAWNSVDSVHALKKSAPLSDASKSYRVVKDHFGFMNAMSRRSGGAEAAKMAAAVAAASRRSYSKAVHFKPTKAYNGKVSKIFLLKDDGGSEESNELK